MGPMARALAGLEPPKKPGWAEATARARDDYLQWTEPPRIPGDVQLGEIMDWLRTRLPADAILTNGAGNYSAWPNRFYRYRQFRTLLGPTSGSMGYGVPAAIAAKRLYPERSVIAFAGDGCFLVTGQEFATACQYGLAIVVVVVNNAMYGTIRMHQERAYPGRVSGTALENPDFAALARAFGGHGELVVRTAEFAPAFERAIASGLPALIELRIDPEAISPNTTLSEIRAKAIAVKNKIT
jgi:acetolactate synthase-1/2/3 large subunit